MDSKERFSSRVGAYVKYRPSYPAEAISFLYDTVGFHPEDEIAGYWGGNGDLFEAAARMREPCHCR